PAALEVSTTDVARMAEVFMGGPGDADGRTASGLERSVVASRLAGAFACLRGVLGGFGVDGADVVPVESRAEIALDAQLLRVSLRVELADVEAPVALDIPAGAVAVATAARTEPLPELAAALGHVPVSVAVRFAPVTLAAADLDDLAVGDVIRLEQAPGGALLGEVEGRQLFVGRAGRHGRRLAVEVHDVTELAG
ncbi:MAG TPA: FliM/FliN family flagellar motor switch protein, partial [Acidimicrobiales bacterium]|nr:FliM/FliN family flagellar motor switch protein [Acidimicrobiales bacterium]